MCRAARTRQAGTWLVVGLVLAVCLVGRRESYAEPGSSDSAVLLGRMIEDFELRDFRGKRHALSDYDQQLVVVYFLGTECPLAKLYGPRIQKIFAEYHSRGVAVLGISSNVQDSILELAAHARRHHLRFPILKDLGNRVADQFGATRTPQVFVLDQDRAIQYYGRVDAQFTFGSGVGLAQPQPQRSDLAIALDELLAGASVSVPYTEAKGCLIGRARAAVEDSDITYSNQISRILERRCVECHREGQIAPFSLRQYSDVSGWGSMIKEVVQQQRMPPWHADPAYGHFANENRLTDEEKQLIYTWVDRGCPEGDPADLAEPRVFQEGWFMPQKPDSIVYMSSEPFEVKAEGVEPYRHFTVDPGFTEDKWVKLAECMPGNRAVVHHIIVYVKPPKKNASSADGDRDERGLTFLAGFAPGTRPLIAPSGWAKKIPAHSKFVFELHYTPIGTKQFDRSSVGLVFMDQKDVTHQMATINATNSKFEIPAFDPHHKVESEKRFKEDTVLLSLFPHMHMRGKSFRFELIPPGSSGEPEILLDVPNYDFNWQNSFILAQPRLIPRGSKLHCTAYFDNSAANLANPDPSETVRWGEQTWEEMMIGWCDVATPIANVDQAGEAGEQRQQASTRSQDLR